MQTDILITKTLREVRKRTLKTTKSFFEVHSLIEKEGVIQFERIDERGIVYLPVLNESFFLSFHFNLGKNSKLLDVFIESGHSVCFSIISNELNFDKLASITKLAPLTGRSEGDITQDGNEIPYTKLIFDPFPSRAYDLHTKIKLLLTELEKDAAGVKKMLRHGTGGIDVCNYMSIDTGTYFSLSKQTIARLSKLGLHIIFEQHFLGK